MAGTVVIIAGLSGGGKTTVAEGLCARESRFKMSRSHTTRAPRGDGRDGEYIYATECEFSRLVACGELLEHTTYSGTSYGTSRTELFSIIDEGKIPVLVLDYNGICSIKKSGVFDTVCAIYLYSDMKTVDERLYGRIASVGITEEGVKTYKTRTNVNLSDCLDMKNRVGMIDAFIENDCLDECIDDCLRYVALKESGKTQPIGLREAIAKFLYSEARRFTPREF